MIQFYEGQVKVESSDGLLTFTVGDLSPIPGLAKRVLGFVFGGECIYPSVTIFFTEDEYLEFAGYRYTYSNYVPVKR